jgi:glycosyltransferase involved in cell wall biosynthesis
MHLAVISGGGVPNPTSGGGALTTYTVLRFALEQGHRVTAYALHDEEYSDPLGADVAARVEHLRSLGAEVIAIVSASERVLAAAPVDVRSRVRRKIAPPLVEIYPHVADSGSVRDAVAEGDAEVAFVYHWEPLSASREVAIPRVAGVGDPSHLPRLYRWRAGSSRRSLRSAAELQVALRRHPPAMAMLLEECAEYGAFAAHHAEWFRSHGAPRCRYLRTPVPDDAGPDWAARREPRATGEPVRLLLLGHMRGIVTVDGLEVFAAMLPELDRLLGRDGYVVDVVGGYEPPPGLRRIFDHPAVRRHGHSDDAGSWLQRADALLVPTSIPLGIRVRVITGFCHGTPIVSHSANALGIPELEHGVNALLGTSPAELAAAVVRLRGDPELGTRLEAGARETYERFFQPGVAAAEILRLLDHVRT